MPDKYVWARDRKTALKKSRMKTRVVSKLRLVRSAGKRRGMKKYAVTYRAARKKNTRGKR